MSTTSFGNPLVEQRDLLNGKAAVALDSKVITVSGDDRLKWLHAGGEKDAGGCEWGIFRVKWDAQGQPVEVWQTLSDMSDLDAEIRREHLAKLGDRFA